MPLVRARTTVQIITHRCEMEHHNYHFFFIPFSCNGFYSGKFCEDNARTLAMILGVIFGIMILVALLVCILHRRIRRKATSSAASIGRYRTRSIMYISVILSIYQSHCLWAMITCSLRLGDVYHISMWSGVWLVQVMACRLFSAKRLPEPMMIIPGETKAGSKYMPEHVFMTYSFCACATFTIKMANELTRIN